MTRLAPLLALALTACAASRTPWVSSGLDGRRGVWTALVVRADDPEAVESTALVEAALRDALREGGRFAPLTLPAWANAELLADASAWLDGPPAASLVALARSSGAHALALVTIERLDPYPPSCASLAIEVHSTETGTLLFAHGVTLSGTPAAALELTGDPLVSLADPSPRRRPARLLSRRALLAAAARELVAPAD